MIMYGGLSDIVLSGQYELLTREFLDILLDTDRLMRCIYARISKPAVHGKKPEPRHASIDRIEIEKGLLAPYKELPREIIQYIFILSANTLVHIPPKPNDVPVVLSHVCTAWRRLALATPELWNHIRIEVRHCHDWLDTLLIAKEWLSRAGSALVSLELYHVTYRCGLQHRGISAIRDVLAPTRQCFKKLDLNLLFQELLQLDQLTDESLAHVESLRLHCQDFAGPNALPVSLFSRHTKLPNLKQLYLDLADWVDLRDLSAKIPVGRLLVLDVTYVPWSSSLLLEVLRQCIFLEKCLLSIKGTGDGDGDPDVAAAAPDPIDIFLPNLHTLALECQDDSGMDEFCSSLVLPQLDTLVVTSKYIGLNWSATAYERLAVRSGFDHTLSKLHIGQTNNFYEVGDVLVHCAALREIFISSKACFDDATFDGLATGRLGPSLRTLIVNRGYCDVDRMLTMVESRLINAGIDAGQAITSFESVALGAVSEEKDIHESRINALREMGVDVRVYTSH